MLILLVLGVLILSGVQPMMMVGSLIMITLIYSLGVFKIMGSYWFGYLLVLVMLSGVMVVFTYMVSLVPNENFEFYGMVFIVLLFLLFLFEGYLMYGDDYSIGSLNLWGFYIGVFNLFLVSFLLSVMVMVVWLSCLEQGAVRVE